MTVPGDGGDSVEVTVVEFAAHTAYLEPVTGTGFLVLPKPDDDVPAPTDAFVEVNWSEQSREYSYSAGLSLHHADWKHALHELDQEGWFLLDDDTGAVEVAGRTSDGRAAVCLCGDGTFINYPDIFDIRRALTALRIAADLPAE
ncbi:hypothetical protein GCM10009789_86650 [Kribbella sancticallisti]|uniref:Uncharacterized protein n=1 Tax=Kribbella sancticallisti TaxID=460087 RepID=A0ABN2EVU2_9ACTN